MNASVSLCKRSFRNKLDNDVNKYKNAKNSFDICVLHTVQCIDVIASVFTCYQVQLCDPD